MRAWTALVFALSALPLSGAAQQMRISTNEVSSEYRLVSLPPELRDQRPVLQIEDHTVQPGETLESILMSRQIAPTPRAMGMVLDANPQLRNVNEIMAGFHIAVPMLAGAPQPGVPVYVGAPAGVYRLNRVKDQLSLRAQQAGDPISQQAFRTLASSLEMAVRPDVGLSASTIESLSRTGQSVMSLQSSGDPEQELRIATYAREVSAAVDEASSNARSGRTNRKVVRVSGTEMPGGTAPAGCRLRYAHEGYTWAGHVVPAEHTSDFETSSCLRGTQVLEAGSFYGIWAEWRDGPHTRRSRIKVLRVLADFEPQIDLPLYPFE